MNDDLKFDIATAPDRASKHWKQGKTTWSALRAMVETTDPPQKKEAGNYLMGRLQPTAACAACRKKGLEVCMTRTNRAVLSRSAITLDLDHDVPEDFPTLVDTVLSGQAYLLHTTFSSKPAEPRYRLIVPTSRSMEPEEFGSATRALMAKLGGTGFDLSCDEPARYMFKPAASDPDHYQAWVVDGDLLSVDDLLTGFVDDLSARPFPRQHRNKRDPYELEGVIGEFNRAYQDDFAALVKQYDLPYAPAGSERWQLVGASAQAGMGEIEAGTGLYYSYHAHDPAYGQTCSAFDLVRIHRFGEADALLPANTPVNRLPSHEMMLDLASIDPLVLNERHAEFADHPEDSWQLDLERNKRTQKPLPSSHNLQLIEEHDPVLAGLRYNEIAFCTETEQDLPWRKMDDQGGPIITETDRGKFKRYLDLEYGIQIPASESDLLIAAASRRRWFNPIQEYLNGLVWDGNPRVETCLPGVEPTPYTRLVARKSLVAAVARALNPGCKWDHTLVLVGPQGIGKTFWVEKMSRGWFGQLGRLDSKDTLLAMQRSWIMTSDEGHTLRKADSEAQKEFLTRTEDVFRLPYEKETTAHPRRCVVWGTTNDEVFLRQQEGNRRFLAVQCTGRLDFATFTDDFVDQVWAEAVSLYRAGERMYLDLDEAALAAETLEDHVEEDALVGILQAYVDNPEDPQEAVCTWQLWQHALGNFSQNPSKSDLLTLFNAMKKMPGWELHPKRQYIGTYGQQRVFHRLESNELDGFDLL